MADLSSCQWIEIPKFEDGRGTLTLVEFSKLFSVQITRVFFLSNVPEGQSRGGHGHKEIHEIFIPLCGSFRLKLHDGRKQEVFELRDPSKAFVMPPGIWANMEDFSSDAIILVLASGSYDLEEHLLDFPAFLNIYGNRTNG